MPSIDSSLVLRLQQEALEKIDIYERQIAKAVLDKIKSMPIARHDTLTRKELDVLIGIATGIGPTAMGERQGVIKTTVDARRKRIMEKLGVHTKSELMLYAFKIAMEKK